MTLFSEISQRMARTVKFVFILLCVIPVSLGIIPAALLEDFKSLATRFQIHYLTITRIGSEDLTNKKSADTLNRCGVRFNVIQPHASTRTFQYKHGAIFVPTVAHLHVKSLIESSGDNRPVFFYSLTESAVPKLFYEIRGIPYRSRVYLILQDAVDGRMLRLKEVYHLHEDSSELLVNDVGQRVHKHGEAKWRFDPRSALVRRANLRGTVFRLLYPVVLFDKKDVGGLNHKVWASEAFFRSVVSNLNVSIGVVKLNERELYGPPSSSGVWHGVVGALIRNEADISASSNSPSSDMIPHVDVVAPYLSIEFRIYYHAFVDTYSLETMIKAFSLEAWCVSVLFLAVLTIALNVISINGPPEEEGTFSISESWINILGCVCLKSWSRRPTTLRLRIFYVSAVLLGFMLNLFYVSQLQANITAQGSAKTLPYDNLESLADASEYQVLMFFGHIPKLDTFAATTGKLKKLADAMRARSNSVILSYPAGMKRICKEKAVLVGVTAACEGLKKASKCPVSASKNTFYRRRIAMFAVKGFAYKKIVDCWIRRSVESGLYQREHSIEYEQPLFSPNEEDTPFTTIGFINVAPFLLIYAVSLTITICLLFLEILIFRGRTN